MRKQPAHLLTRVAPHKVVHHAPCPRPPINFVRLYFQNLILQKLMSIRTMGAMGNWKLLKSPKKKLNAHAQNNGTMLAGLFGGSSRLSEEGRGGGGGWRVRGVI